MYSPLWTNILSLIDKYAMLDHMQGSGSQVLNGEPSFVHGAHGGSTRGSGHPLRSQSESARGVGGGVLADYAQLLPGVPATGAHSWAAAAL